MRTSAVEKDGLGLDMETGIAAKTPAIGIGGGAGENLLKDPRITNA